MRYTDDPIADYDAYEAECAERLEKRPLCYICGERIQDEYLFEIDGDLICEECLKDNYRRSTDSYIDD